MIASTFSSFAISGSGFRAFRYCMTEVREITRSPPILARSVMSCSVMPSAKYSCSGSPDRFSSGKTATDRIWPEDGAGVHEPRNSNAAVAKTPMASNPPTSQAERRGRRSTSPAVTRSEATDVFVGPRVPEPVSDGPSSARRRSPMSRTRSFGSFRRQRRRNVSSAEGMSGGKAVQSGSVVNTAAMVSDESPPGNGRRPVSVSNSTHPNAQMSVRLSTDRPRACSGLMYAAVPTTACAAAVRVGSCGPLPDGSSAFARPKSRTFTVPSGRSLMFAGFKSR